MRERKPIQCSWHLNVGDENLHIAVGFKQPVRLIRCGGLDDLIALVRQGFHRH
ncbi:hypothetical protein OCOJLMKI_5207 [Methylobacterium iners]|uniref:Transposase n=1 Tax=Methylobacterium iners TaxID=418707 RepID=A0ABQ4S842_9HYPH|nr:hypothetical protein OCOJLMKI_5207 [Methylobacterium iners]